MRHRACVALIGSLATLALAACGSSATSGHPLPDGITEVLEAPDLPDVESTGFPDVRDLSDGPPLDVPEVLAGDTLDESVPDVPVATALPYPVVDTAQTTCYSAQKSIPCPAAGEAFFGQDAQHLRFPPHYAVSDDGLTVQDLVTGLTWERTPDINGDGVIDVKDKRTLPNAVSRPDELNAMRFGGYDDWRLPSLKELYSLIVFTGLDPHVQGTDTTGLTPFIDTTAFRFAYGDTGAGERVIDSQYASSTPYVWTTMTGRATQFGVNFADGRIKGYPVDGADGGKPFLVQCVRGNPAYGINDFADNQDGTITDHATGLMWSREDSGEGMNWPAALAWVAAKNAAKYLGHDDWRLPEIKELQSLVDYTRSPDTTASAAIDARFACTPITNEGGKVDYPYFWSSTTHAAASGIAPGAYVAFGRAMGYMSSTWMDVHGAGAQRSDPKDGDPASYPVGHGPQGDAIRVLNFVRLVRDLDGTYTPSDATGPDTPDVPEAGQDAFQPDPGVPDPGHADLGPDAVTGPASCTGPSDCTLPGACPPDAPKGCTCSADPQGHQWCIPACSNDADCPKPPDKTLSCGPDGLCVPKP